MSDHARKIQSIAFRIDECIREGDDEQLTLSALAQTVGYSESAASHLFHAVSGMTLRDYLSARRLAFALKDVRDTRDSLLSIAVRYGFSSGEAFSRAFRSAYGIGPREYRKHPVPVALRTVLRPFDCYLMEEAMKDTKTLPAGSGVKIYYVRIPAHKYLHIRNFESIGYWDFWQKQSLIPGQDCDTVCGLLDSIPQKLDDVGGTEPGAASGQLMAWINAPTGRLCGWGIPLAESYGVRLPADYAGPVPEPLGLMDVAEGDYIVFEHGPFDFETECQAVEAQIEAAMKDYPYADDGYELDLTQERVFYFYMDPTRFFKYVRPVRPIGQTDHPVLP